MRQAQAVVIVFTYTAVTGFIKQTKNTLCILKLFWRLYILSVYEIGQPDLRIVPIVY